MSKARKSLFLLAGCWDEEATNYEPCAVVTQPSLTCDSPRSPFSVSPVTEVTGGAVPAVIQGSPEHLLCAVSATYVLTSVQRLRL